MSVTGEPQGGIPRSRVRAHRKCDQKVLLPQCFWQTVGVANRTYAQWCPVSRALDVIGDRWTLLIVRDLCFGVRRFSDLQAELVGISPSLLSSRLRLLSDHGVIERIGARYRLTERGAGLADVINEIGRWGVELLDDRADEESESDFFARAKLGFMIRAEELPETELVAELHLDDRVHTVRIAPGGNGVRPSRRVTVVDGHSDRDPDVRVRGTFDALTRYRQGRLSVDDLLDNQALVIDGSPEAASLLNRMFSAG